MRALLDTCVLVPSLGRDLLLSIAVENVYVPRWSNTILEELSEVLRRQFAHKGRAPVDASAYISHLLSQMNGAFPDALVAERYEALVGSFGLPDPDDEHLVAAAVVCGATTIVSDNTSDLPADKLPDHIEVVTAKDFVHGAVAARRTAVRRAIGEMAKRHRIGLVETVGLLEKKRWLRPDAADALRVGAGISRRRRAPRDSRRPD